MKSDNTSYVFLVYFLWSILLMVASIIALMSGQMRLSFTAMGIAVFWFGFGFKGNK